MAKHCIARQLMMPAGAVYDLIDMSRAWRPRATRHRHLLSRRRPLAESRLPIPEHTRVAPLSGCSLKAKLTEEVVYVHVSHHLVRLLAMFSQYMATSDALEWVGRREGIVTENMKLIYNGRPLPDDGPAMREGIHLAAALHMVRPHRARR